MEHPTYDRLVTRTSDAVAAGTDDDVDGTGVPVKGFVDHHHHVLLGTITATAVTTVKLQESDDDTTYTDIAGKSVSVADSGDDEVYSLRAGVEELKASTTHTRVRITRATANAVIDGAICVQRRMIA